MSTYDIGDLITLNFTVSVSNVLTDPTTITLTVTAPDMSITTPAVAKDSVGTYHYDLTPTLAGTYRYRWVTVGVAQTAQDGTVDVRASNVGAVSLDDVRQFENRTSTVDDEELRGFIDAAQGILSRLVGPLIPTVVSEVQDGGTPVLVLRKWPVISVTSVTYATSQAVLMSDLDLDPETGIVYWKFGTVGVFLGGRRFLTATYVAGRNGLPADLRQAVLELVKHLWESQTGGNRRPNFAADGTNAQIATSYLLPYRVESLIKPHLSPRLA